VSSCAGCHACTGTLERHVGEKLVAAVTRAAEDAGDARRAGDRASAADAARRSAALERSVDPRDLRAWLRPLPSLRASGRANAGASGGEGATTANRESDRGDENGGGGGGDENGGGGESGGGGGDEDDPVSDGEAEGRRLPLSHLVPPRFLRAPAPVACRGRCGAEFCSRACEAGAWDRWHRLLCPGTWPRGDGGGAAGRGKARAGRRGGSGGAAAAKPPAIVEAGVRVDRAAVARFLAHADEHNDIFRVAGQVVALLLVETDGLLLPPPPPPQEKGPAGGERPPAPAPPPPPNPLAALSRAALPFAVAHRRPWWECVARPDDVSPGAEEAEFRAQLRSLAADSLALLAAALKPERPELAAALLSAGADDGEAGGDGGGAGGQGLAAYGSLVGMFELNNLALNVPPPLDAYVALLNGDDLPNDEEEEEEGNEREGASGGQAAAAASSAAAAAAGPSPPLAAQAAAGRAQRASAADRDAAAALVAPLLHAMGPQLAGEGTQGTAFYALQSCCNHACAPAARAEGRAAGDVALVAVRDLSPGEELAISYLPLDDEEGEEGEEEEEDEAEGGGRRQGEGDEADGGSGDEGEAPPPPPPPRVPQPLAERRAALRDYGFECACERCEAEELAEAVGGS